MERLRPSEEADRKISAGGPLVDLDGPAVTVDDPVLANAVAGVELALDREIPLLGDWGENLDHEIGRSFDPFVDNVAVCVENGDDVRLNDGLIGKDDIHRGVDDDA